MTESRKAYISKFKAKLDEWNAELDKMEAKAREVGADARIELERRKDEIREKRDSLRRRVSVLEAATDDAWDELKGGAAEALKHIEKAGSRLKSALK